MWVDKLHRTKVATTFLALVAISIQVVAVGAFAHNISVSKELVSFFVIILFALFLNKLSIFVKLLEEVACKFIMSIASSTTINIKTDTKISYTNYNKYVSNFCL